MIVVQLSDTHFGRENPVVVDALRRCLQAQSPDLLLVSGDITQRARGGQFRAAGNFLADLPAPRVLSIPGNHDIPLYNLVARLLWPYRGYCRVLGDELEPAYISDTLCVICVNTVRRYRHAGGCINVAQIEQVGESLSVAPASAIKVVVAHHPFAVMLPSDVKHRVRGATAALRAWSRQGVDLLLGGHIHYPFMAPLREHVTGLKGDPWVVQAGTAVSRRVRSGMPNSFVRLQLDGGRAGVCLQRWDYSRAQDAFMLAQSFTPWR
ncbi:metallophosphoesterase family protein [Exilibacterium tricleocarpae]|uniref:metallophosphoesterase family protein n=1 Tax=Exilibacterium tricleocarpae TaxID=2591008 RepID=UPI0015D33F65|nr:metallophosphoesterase [Exilibacterium tricleocarpae]